MEAIIAPVTRQMTIGLGEAIQRVLKLEQRLSNGFESEHDREERQLILDALNLTTLDLGFDCGTTKESEIPSTLAIFAKSAATSCCRILPTDQSRRRAAPVGEGQAAPPTTPPTLTVHASLASPPATTAPLSAIGSDVKSSAEPTSTPAPQALASKGVSSSRRRG